MNIVTAAPSGAVVFCGVLCYLVGGDVPGAPPRAGLGFAMREEQAPPLPRRNGVLCYLVGGDVPGAPPRAGLGFTMREEQAPPLPRRNGVLCYLVGACIARPFRVGFGFTMRVMRGIIGAPLTVFATFFKNPAFLSIFCRIILDKLQILLYTNCIILLIPLN